MVVPGWRLSKGSTISSHVVVRRLGEGIYEWVTNSSPRDNDGGLVEPGDEWPEARRCAIPRGDVGRGGQRRGLM